MTRNQKQGQAMQKHQSQNNAVARYVRQREEHLAGLIGDSAKARNVAEAATIAIQDSEDLRNCTPESVYRSVCKAAKLQLDVSTGEAYLVPFKGECSMMVGYKGFLVTAQRAGFHVIAHAVYSADEFEATEVPLALRFSAAKWKKEERGEYLGSFAAAYDAQSGRLHSFVWVSAEEVERTKKSTPAWSSWPGQMRRKLAIKRLCAELPSPELRRLNAEDNRTEAALSEGLVVPAKQLSQGSSSFGSFGSDYVAQPTAEPDPLDGDDLPEEAWGAARANAEAAEKAAPADTRKPAGSDD